MALRAACSEIEIQDIHTHLRIGVWDCASWAVKEREGWHLVEGNNGRESQQALKTERIYLFLAVNFWAASSASALNQACLWSEINRRARAINASGASRRSGA